MSENPEKVIIVGAGLSGLLGALYLVKKGYAVDIYERRPDIRKDAGDFSSAHGLAASTTKRSINMTLSTRGEIPLREIGLFERVAQFSVECPHRTMHYSDGTIGIQPYGINGQAIRSISRQSLQFLLLEEIEKTPHVQVYFEHKVQSIRGNHEAVIRDMRTNTDIVAPYKLLVGADGAFSSVRENFMNRLCRMSRSIDYIDLGYKEFTIPAKPDGSKPVPFFESFHIWPRHNYMFIGQPNPDHSLTCTLFAPYEGYGGFDTVDESSDESILNYFRTHFPDVVGLIPDLVKEYRTNPIGSLATVRCKKWNFEDSILLMGDAAHGVLPFYGQGVNAAFEDWRLFSESLSRHTNLKDAINEFTATRIASTNGLADLSYGNYLEMAHKTTSKYFLLKRTIDRFLNRWFPNTWIPLYTMVSFTTIPYDQAITRGERQDSLLNRFFAITGTFCGLGLIYGASVIASKRRNK